MSEIADRMTKNSSDIGGKHCMVTQDQAMEQITVVVVDYSSSSAKISIYADTTSFHALRSAVTHAASVVQKPLPTMKSSGTATEFSLEARQGILSACVITGVMAMQKPGLQTRLELVVPTVWERATRLAHEARAGSPESRQEVFECYQVAKLPSPRCNIDPSNIS